jgi:uncharacterized protein (DUF305 family)
VVGNTRRTIIFVAGLVVIVGAVVAVTLTRRDHTPTGSGLGVDLAFAQEMVPHHVDAVEMAELAETKTNRPAVKFLARDIITAQTQEIQQLQAIDQRLAAQGVEPADLATAQGHNMYMGTTMPGMSVMSQAELDALSSADPFDRAFIDAMIPHHQMAILMARDVLARGADPEVRKIASAVIAAQSKEITQMNSWRRDWYGIESPSGGVPV